MKNAQGKYDFKEKSKIYKKFLKDSNKTDKEHYRQCLLIIAYSKYKNSEYDKAYKNLERLFKDTEAEEEAILGKNESLEQKLINLPATMYLKFLSFRVNPIQYLNDFTENDIQGEEDLNKLAKLRILNQKIYYFYGFLKFSDYKKKRNKIKTELMTNPELINNKEKLKDEVRNKMKIHSKLLIDAAKFLNKSKTINNSMHFNKIKCIFILILLSNCAYLSEEYPEASNHLREALLAFSELNKLFFDKEIDKQVDPRVMFIINGVIMEQILYNIGKICNRVQKKKLAAWVFNKLLEITYFRSENIHRKACNKLYEILFLTKFSSQQKNQEASYYMSECLLKKIKNRFDNKNKSLLIMVSENLLKNFCSQYELREVLLKCMEKHLNKSDKLNYIQFDNEFKISYFDTVEQMLPKLKTDNDFCKYSENLIDSMKVNLAKILKKSIDLFIKENNSNNMEETNSNDRYIFLFVFANDFRFNTKEESHEIIQLLVVNKISLYIFILDDISERKIFKIKQYLNCLMEGYLILVKNFQIIEESFNNITPVSIRRKKNGEVESTENCFSHNILDSNFENHKFIL